MTHPSSPPPGGRTRPLTLELDSSTYEELSQAAGERDLQPAELVERWLRERLAHERERRLGRARPERP